MCTTLVNLPIHVNIIYTALATVYNVLTTNEGYSGNTGIYTNTSFTLVTDDDGESVWFAICK